MKTRNPVPARSRRIGLFGGTFNPIHCGHIQVALDVLHAFHLDCIYFVPSAQPPHKSGGNLASAADRLQMVRLALKGHDRLKVSDTEIRRTGPSYSIDTVIEFKTAAPEPCGLFFLVGVDAFLEIHTWKDYKGLFENTRMVVMSRPGNGQWTEAIHRQVADYVKRHIDAGYQFPGGAPRLVHPRLCDIYFASVTPLDVASTQIRDILKKGGSITEWVPPVVAEYIYKRRLFNEQLGKGT